MQVKRKNTQSKFKVGDIVRIDCIDPKIHHHEGVVINPCDDDLDFGSYWVTVVLSYGYVDGFSEEMLTLLSRVEE